MKILRNIPIIHETKRAFSNTFLNPLQRYQDSRITLLYENDPEKRASLHCESGFYCMRLKKYKTALKHHKKAMSIYQSIYGEKHPTYVMSMDTYTNNLLALEKNQLALEMLQKSLNVKIEVYGQNHFITAEAHRSLGISFLNMKQPEQAVTHLKKALGICKKSKNSYAMSLIPSIRLLLAKAYNARDNAKKTPIQSN